jgi:hypothetical protein
MFGSVCRLSKKKKKKKTTDMDSLSILTNGVNIIKCCSLLLFICRDPGSGFFSFLASGKSGLTGGALLSYTEPYSVYGTAIRVPRFSRIGLSQGEKEKT